MSKNKQVKTAKVAAPASLSTRLSKSRGRIIGVTTMSGNKVRKINGQVQNVSAKYATVYDRNKKVAVKFALSSVLAVTGV